jgi:hypothetical protein
MHSLTKVSGVAVSVLVAATASVLLVLPTHPRLRTSRGAGMTPAIMVASATARPPAGQPLALGGAAHRCQPPAAPGQDCRVFGDSTGGTRAATAGRRRCRHGPLVTAQPGGTGRAYGGRAGSGRCCPSPGRTGQGRTGQGRTGQGRIGQGGTGQGGTGLGGTGLGSTGAGGGGAGRVGVPAGQGPARQSANCPTGIPRRPR